MLQRTRIGEKSSPLETLKERLEWDEKSRGYRCPAHDDSRSSLSVAEGRDGAALVYCFAGCTTEQIVEAVGLELRDLFPARDDYEPKHRPTRRRDFALDRETAEKLLSSSEFRVAWTIAMQLAKLPARRARHEIVLAWDAITQHADPKLVAETADLIRGTALFAFGDAAELTPKWSEHLQNYVEGDGLEKAVERMNRAVKRTLRSAGVAG